MKLADNLGIFLIKIEGGQWWMQDFLLETPILLLGGGGATSDMGAVWQKKKIVKTKELAPAEGRPEYANVCDYRSTTRGHSKHCSHRVTCPCISGHGWSDKICWFLPCLVLCSDKIEQIR